MFTLCAVMKASPKKQTYDMMCTLASRVFSIIAYKLQGQLYTNYLGLNLEATSPCACLC